jgi:hypothetical protein
VTLPPPDALRTALDRLNPLVTMSLGNGDDAEYMSLRNGLITGAEVDDLADVLSVAVGMLAAALLVLSAKTGEPVEALWQRLAAALYGKANEA